MLYSLKLIYVRYLTMDGKGNDKTEGFNVFVGTFVHSATEEPLRILTNHVLGVKNSKIVFFESKNNLETLKRTHGFHKVTHLLEGQFIIPGLIDTHIHASQYPNAGAALDLPLLKWLENYTFPVEANFSDLKFAKEAYRKAVKCSLRNGTTTALYFATIHLEGTLQLCDAVEEFGQRALVGKVCMDKCSPDYYCEDTAQSIKDTERFIEAVSQRKNRLLTPVVTPRFAVTSTKEQLLELGKIAEKHNVPIQSHLSETRPECDAVKEQFPEHSHYCDVYDKCKLFTQKTVMAHCIYLSDEELDLIRKRGVGVSHCPNSNLSIRSGLMDARKILDRNIKVGLGTDVSGGYSVSILNAIRLAVQTSNVLSIQRYGSDYKPITYKDAFRMATLGGAQVLGLEERIGNFEVGKDFDALIIDTNIPGTGLEIFKRDKLEDIVQKFFHLGDDRNICEIYVAGRKVLT